MSLIMPRFSKIYLYFFECYSVQDKCGGDFFSLNWEVKFLKDFMYRPGSNWNDKKFHPIETKYFSNKQLENRLKSIFSSKAQNKLNETIPSFPISFTSFFQIFKDEPVKTMEATVFSSYPFLFFLKASHFYRQRPVKDSLTQFWFLTVYFMDNSNYQHLVEYFYSIEIENVVPLQENVTYIFSAVGCIYTCVLYISLWSKFWIHW